MSKDDSDATEQRYQQTAPTGAAGSRFDAVAAMLFSDYSRSRLQDWIKRGFLTTDGQQRRPSDKLIGGEEIMLVLPPDALADTWEETWANGAAQIEADEMSIDFVHTDEQFYIVNKPTPLVMHPAPGNRRGTLMNGLLHFEPGLRHVPRAGIVHRLDKDTTGLCVVARTLKAHAHLVSELQARKVSREYLAIVLGDIPDAGTIDEPIGRHPKDRKRMAVVQGGKPARTHFHVLERFDYAALVAVQLETGRTHQIRVHMTHLGFPLLGDPVYTRRGASARLDSLGLQAITGFNRQALHAYRLSLAHPEDLRQREFQAEPPDDFNNALQALRDHAAQFS